MNAATPDLTVIMATPKRCATIRRPLRFLQQQTNRERIELILLGPEDSSFDDLDPALLAGFARCLKMAVGPIEEVERAFAPGIAAATAPVVALLENHVYPEPSWGEAIVRAYQGPWTVVASPRPPVGSSTCFPMYFMTNWRPAGKLNASPATTPLTDGKH